MSARSKNSSNSDAVATFISITGASNKDATKFLTATNYNVERAVDNFYAAGNTGSSTSSSVKKARVDAAKLAALFEGYKESTVDEIQVAGLTRWCQDLEVDPMDVIMLVICFHLKCKTMCVFTRTEFVDGWTAIGCDSIDSMKASLNKLKTDTLNSPTKFAEFYNWVFGFALEPPGRNLSVQAALSLWSLLIADKFAQWPLFQQFWSNRTQSVQRDTWEMTLPLATIVSADLSNYEDDPSYPAALDEFVAFAREEMAKK